VSEIVKIAKSLPAPLELVSFTGGETFIRDDVPEIVLGFWKGNKPYNIYICTNGLLSDKIYRQAKEIASKCECPILFQVSIDGLEPVHDKIRGVKGSFKKAVRTIERLKSIDAPNLDVAALIVFHKGNIDGLYDVVDYFENDLKVEYHPMIMREIPEGIWGLDEESMADLQRSRLELPDMSMLEEMDSFFRKKRKYSHASHLFNRFRYQIKMLKTKKRLFSCYSAGNIQGVIYANGDVSLCEFTKPVGNLRDRGYSFPKVWSSEAADQMRKRIKKCYCIHDCYFIDNLKHYLDGRRGSYRKKK